jgi:hypothetical protein
MKENIIKGKLMFARLNDKFKISRHNIQNVTAPIPSPKPIPSLKATGR